MLRVCDIKKVNLVSLKDSIVANSILNFICSVLHNYFQAKFLYQSQLANLRSSMDRDSTST